MADTYSYAEAVIVIDLELLQHRSMSTSAVENLFRILCSAWMRRVWTLHEAVLIRAILVVFKDGVFDVDRAVRTLRRQTVALNAFDPVTNEACRFVCRFRAISYAD